jgi:hypothetical protein
MERSVGASGMMPGMNKPDTKPTPSLPWYRALVTRTPRGRRLRRRLAIVVAIVTAPVWVHEMLGVSPRVVLHRLGFNTMPHQCHRARECAMPCKHGHAYCFRGASAKDPTLGICICPTKEQLAERIRTYAECPDHSDPIVIRDDGPGEALVWTCASFDFDGGEGGLDPGGDGGTVP